MSFLTSLVGIVLQSPEMAPGQKTTACLLNSVPTLEGLQKNKRPTFVDLFGFIGSLKPEKLTLLQRCLIGG